MMPRTFIVRDETIAARVHGFIDQNAGPQIKAGKPLRVVIAPHVEDRTDAQNRFMWVAVLTPISKQVNVLGKRFSPEAWNEMLKEEYLPEENSKGKKKWQILPNGQRRLQMSTTDLDVEEMTEYLHKIQAYAASDLGVDFDNKS
ncbi:recombination protein NinB [Caldimonas brevitalea]|uniref:Uncharacterized protein n=1 Tax=Caldimonas brevitalea TaxID=413882 RepID=A0A0G3BQI3_9BURK|nr:recombination protein NinB [Caldimonas brevitalea]AKJ28760.1 hypothetical protein AAW51_2069 [Caldimonas brevitalea]